MCLVCPQKSMGALFFDPLSSFLSLMKEKKAKENQGDEDRLVLDKLSAHSTKEYPATAFVQLQLDGEKLSTSSIGGNGPVDAVYNAILTLTGLDIKMSHYNLTAKGEGAEALGQVDIVVEHEGRKFHGVGLATDIVESSALALVHAINAIYRAHKVADIKSHKHH
ncbi:MAG: alpha-isopropylmalate synthase regulatory domain-containing protein [Aggregatibacter sp.]|uniref:alpha-isopropylmalate synthase regulatory domain-containing protein n=1 Tax=Aggregatibacter sp. TaxID=1872413 RepID=UPI0036082FF2